MKKAAVLLAVLMLASGSALAHGRARVQLGFHFGFPLYAPYWHYPPPVYYYPYPAVVAPPASLPVYVERNEEWWYYCEQTRAYYPYVKECPMGWKRVPPAPPPAQ